MKLLLMLCAAWSAWGAGSVTSTLTSIPGPGGTATFVLTYSWTGDASTGSVPATASPALSANPFVQGYYMTAITVTPGSPSPTGGYAVTVKDANGYDWLAGQAASLSATAPASYANTAAPPLSGSLTLAVTGNSVASAQGSVVVYFANTRTTSNSGWTDDGTTITAQTGRNVQVGGNLTISATCPAGAPAGSFCSMAAFFPHPFTVNLTALSADRQQSVAAPPGAGHEWYYDTRALPIGVNGSIGGSLFDAKLLPNGNALYAVGRDSRVTPQTGVAEVNLVTGETVFQWNNPSWTSGSGPESVWKYPNGNYLIADVDGANSTTRATYGTVYEMRPDHSLVWTWNGSGGNNVLPVAIGGVDSVVLFGYGGGQSHVTVIRRDTQATVWDMSGFTSANGGDFRTIGGVNYLLVAEWQANPPHVLLVNYDTKTIAQTLVLSEANSYGPLNAVFLSDTTVAVADGNDHKFTVATLTPSTQAVLYQTVDYGAITMNVSALVAGKQVVWAGSDGYVHLTDLGLTSATTGIVQLGAAPNLFQGTVSVLNASTGPTIWTNAFGVNTTSAPVAQFQARKNGSGPASMFYKEDTSGPLVMGNTAGNFWMGCRAYNASTTSLFGCGKASSATGAITDSWTVDDAGNFTAVASVGVGAAKWTTGTGAPSANCTIGSLYSNVSGGANTTLYVCTAANTWTAK